MTPTAHRDDARALRHLCGSTIVRLLRWSNRHGHAGGRTRRQNEPGAGPPRRLISALACDSPLRLLAARLYLKVVHDDVSILILPVLPFDRGNEVVSRTGPDDPHLLLRVGNMPQGPSELI